MAPKIVDSFSTEEVSKAIDYPLQTVNYWARVGLVSPSISSGVGRGKVRRWSLQDIVIVRIVAEMRGAGLSLQAIRKAGQNVQRLKMADDALRDSFLVTDGRDVFIRSGSDLVSVLKQPGQSVMRTVFDLGRTVAEVREVTEKIIAARAAA